MRRIVSLALVLVLGSIAVAQEKKSDLPPRFGVGGDLENYPQTSAKQTMISIGKALERKRVDYLLAHLCEPGFIDDKVKEFGGRFSELITEVTNHLSDDPKRTQELKKFLTQGEVAESGTSAKVTLKDVPGRQLLLRQIDGRWYMQNDADVPTKK